MVRIDKVCPVVLRIRSAQQWDLLAFEHPLAGFQLVKGRLEPGENPEQAARRELHEESGLVCTGRAEYLFSSGRLPDQGVWHFYFCQFEPALEETWIFATADDGGHCFRFFWHPADRPLDCRWHPLYHSVYAMLLPRLVVRLQRK